MNNYLKLFLLILLVSIAGCTKLDPLGSQTDDEQLATLNSLKQINDYPFYTMTYYGDYNPKNYEPGALLPGTAISKDNYMCTCFTAKGTDANQLFGRNFDSDSHIALLLYTHPKDGYASVSMVFLAGLGLARNHPLDSDENRAILLSSPYFPGDGINECGVTIACMSVDKAEPPYNPHKTTFHRMFINRLILDYAKDLEEAIQLLNKYNFYFPYDPNHYLICDASGNSAVIEFLGGEIKIIRKKENWQVSTNTLLSETKMPEVANFSIFNPDTWSKWRYAKVYETLKKTNGITTVSGAMDILNSVSLTPNISKDFTTMWSAVYNLTTRQVDIVINKDYSLVHHFSINIF
jgi:hypothetical protein